MSTEKECLKAELRAAREAIVRKHRNHPHEGGPVRSPSTQFPWLQTLSEAELEEHIQRLERYLRDITTSFKRIRETRSTSDSTPKQMTFDDITEELH